MNTLTKKERAELVLYLTDSKKGAAFRISCAAKAGVSPDPRDIEMMGNKQGRPQKNDFQSALYEEDVMDDYCELRTHGISYEHACEIIVYLRNLYTEKTISSKHIKAIITKWNNHAQKEFFKHYPCKQDDSGSEPEAEWIAFIEKQKACLRECKAFWGRKFYYKEAQD